MSRILIFTFLLLFSQISWGQDSKSENQTLTESQVQIEGTNLFLIPPPDFEQSEEFKGLKNPDDPTSMIMIMELPAPFSEMKNAFTSEALATQGMTLVDKKDWELSGAEAIYFEVEQGSGEYLFYKYIIVFGDEEATTMINGVFLKEDTELGPLILKSLESLVIDNDLDIDPRESLNYSLEEKVGNLNFCNVMGKDMYFARECDPFVEDKDRTALIVARSFEKIEIENQKFFCTSRLKNMPFESNLIDEKGINEVEIDGLKGYELYAQNLDEEGENIYQVTLFEEDGGYFLFMGTYLSGNEKSFNDVKKVIQTFQRD